MDLKSILKLEGFFLFLVLSATACNLRYDSTSSGTTPSVNIRGSIITVEVADTPALRAQGLSARASLEANSGMLFLFDFQAKPSFWMKDMKFALDFLWLRNASVVDIIENVPPPATGTPDSGLTLYTPAEIVDSVLEVNAGYVAQHQIQKGDKITLNLGR